MIDPEEPIINSAGISPLQIEDPRLRRITAQGWYIAYSSQVIRYAAVLDQVFTLALASSAEEEQIALLPPTSNVLKAGFTWLGNTSLLDYHRIMQNLMAGAILQVFQQQLAHYAGNLGFKPHKLDRGEPIRGVRLTRILWAARNSHTHAGEWKVRDFKKATKGAQEIRVLKRIGVEPFRFHSLEVLQLITSGDLGRLRMQLLSIAQELVEEAVALPPSKRPAKKSKQIRHA